MNQNNNNGEYSASEYEDDAEEYFETYSPPTEAVIILLDVDSFEVQVHGLHRGYSPEQLRSKPFVVANEFGVLTAVNYPAKDAGIRRTKDFNGNNVHLTCPGVTVLEIPNHYRKPNSLIAKKASDAIFDCLTQSVSNLRSPIVEKASKDEFYIDVTDEVYFRVHNNRDGQLVPDASVVKQMKDRCHNETPSRKVTGDTFSYRTLQVLKNPNIRQKRHETEAFLVHGATIAHQLLNDIQESTHYVFSAGVSSNKLLAKIGCGRHKPNAITIFPQASLPRLSKCIFIEDIPGLGGQLGKDIKTKFRIEYMSQLYKIERVDLQKFCGGEIGIKFHQLAIGFDPTKVVSKHLSSSMKCGISFNFRTRRMSNKSYFEEHLMNRFLEMREHLAHECNQNGCDRFPKSFKLKVKTRKRGFYSAFGETLNSSLIEGLNHESVPPFLLNKNHFNKSPPLPFSWIQLHNRFFNSLKTNCSIPIFDSNTAKANEAVRKVSEINLYANFNVD